MKKNLLLSILLFFLIPQVTLAFTSLNPSTPNPVVGDDFYVQFNIDYLIEGKPDPRITDYNACITFDPNYFEYKDVTWYTPSIPFDTSTPGKICFNRPGEGPSWSAKISPFVITFKVKKSGLTEIRITHNGSESHYGNGEPIAQSYAGLKINPVEPNTDTAIGSLGVKNYTIHPTFSKTHYEYYLTVEPEVTKIYVDAKPLHNKQTIKGAGYHNLEFGLNAIHVTVIAQDGSTRDYTINVTRTDNRNGDTKLKLLTVSDTIIKYEEGKTYYEAIVSRSVDSVMIDARPNDPNATLLGTGRRNLEIGDNYFDLILKTKKNDTDVEQKYTLKITRSNEELEKVIQSSKLKSISINNLVVNLSDEKKVIYTGIYDNSTRLDLETQAESRTAEVKTEGNRTLKTGLNEIKITVTENNEETTEYKIIAYKLPSAVSINSLNNITSTSDNMYYNTGASSVDKITASQLKYLSNNNYKLYYNAVDFYNGLIYQVLIDNPKEKEEIEVSFLKQEDPTPTYKTKLGEGFEMMLFVGDAYPDDQAVKIYTYNEEGKYKLLTDGVKVKNGYINFKTNGDENYVFTIDSLIQNEGPVTAFINKYKTYLLGGIAGLVVLILLFRLIKQQKAKKNKNEPLY